jgi:hypothetical protein
MRRRLVPAKVSARRTFDMIEVEHELVVQLRRDAAIRSMPVAGLIRELLGTIVSDKLVDAVLDDGAGRQVRSRMPS